MRRFSGVVVRDEQVPGLVRMGGQVCVEALDDALGEFPRGQLAEVVVGGAVEPGALVAVLVGGRALVGRCVDAWGGRWLARGDAAPVALVTGWARVHHPDVATVIGPVARFLRLPEQALVRRALGGARYVAAAAVAGLSFLHFDLNGDGVVQIVRAAEHVRWLFG